jgi:hypothetical protein
VEVLHSNLQRKEFDSNYDHIFSDGFKKSVKVYLIMKLAELAMQYFKGLTYQYEI